MSRGEGTPIDSLVASTDGIFVISSFHLYEIYLRLNFEDILDFKLSNLMSFELKALECFKK